MSTRSSSGGKRGGGVPTLLLDALDLGLGCQERRYDLRVEVPPRLGLNHVVGGLVRQCVAIMTVVGQGIEHVGHGADASPQRYRVAAQAVGVAAAVPFLVMGQRDLLAGLEHVGR